MEKRRELRRKEEQGDEELEVPAGRRGRVEAGGARVNRRRSRSTGDADGLARGLTPRDGKTMRTAGLLDVAPFESEEDPLADSIARELRRLGGASQTKYHVRQREGTIYASADVETVSHMKSAGDVDTGKAWRTVRRPSDMVCPFHLCRAYYVTDMNIAERACKAIREYRAQEKPGKAYGKVFVKVIGVKGLNVPIPQQPTALTCTLNNGIHFVTTPECRLARDCRIDQEFELIEHSKLEFTLTLKIKRDPHIIAQFKANAPQPPPPVKAVPQQPASKGGMRGIFSSKRSAPAPTPSSPARPQLQIQENLARYLKQDGTLARCFTEFKLMGQRLDNKGKMESQEVGELVLQMFRLPPLGGIPPNQLPQSLDECWTGLRRARWHKMTYFEGTLTQNGGDCTTWRRRRFRIIGANMVAFNDVTKKATATIDLRKAVSIDDVPDGRSRTFSPVSPSTKQSRSDEYDGLYGVERSFRLIFSKDQEIVFFADTDEEKKRWLEVLNIMVGHIPPNPLWAELLRQRQQELEKQGLARQAAAPHSAVPGRSSTQNFIRS
ncbi:hypothetical protein EWM64_g3217 [Hericium alpestre]|uniref:PH domain-containing protein n=1 Tax=Hericium alpestre TaxID=135208 RepID=A0A4Z0A395_9AGAM|nr:hypothetical protein EWM64_g3217 [Hericium alpestre]